MGLLCKGLYKTNCSTVISYFPRHTCALEGGTDGHPPSLPLTPGCSTRLPSSRLRPGSLEGWGALLRTVSVAPDTIAPSLFVNSFSPGSPPNSRLLRIPRTSTARLGRQEPSTPLQRPLLALLVPAPQAWPEKSRKRHRVTFRVGLTLVNTGRQQAP